MTIDKANVTEKSDLVTTQTPIANKVTASDINELRRASDDVIDFLDASPVTEAVYGGLYICEGTGPAQTISSGQKILINQWQEAQLAKGIQISHGDQSITIPEAGVYEMRFHISYETSARNGEIFKIRTVENGEFVPGVCTRVQHQHPNTTTYQASAGRLVEYTNTKTISLEFEALTLGSDRTIVVRHASLAVFRVDAP